MTVVSMDVSGAPVEGFLAVPDGGRGPGVLVVQEWWGLVPHIRSVVERLAEAGFVAMAVDHYRGIETTEPDEAEKLMMGLQVDAAAADLPREPTICSPARRSWVRASAPSVSVWVAGCRCSPPPSARSRRRWRSIRPCRGRTITRSGMPTPVRPPWCTRQSPTKATPVLASPNTPRRSSLPVAR